MKAAKKICFVDQDVEHVGQLKIINRSKISFLQKQLLQLNYWTEVVRNNFLRKSNECYKVLCKAKKCYYYLVHQMKKIVNSSF